MLISSSAIVEFDRWIDDEIEAVLQSIEAGATPTATSDLPIYHVLRYHLGTANAAFEPESADPGKRLRSKLCLLCCDAAGGDPRQAVPVAASIELLHNFTLIHDDIQDMAELRRHRQTVWSLWGVPQAINAGDAMFAAAHVALNRSVERGVPAQVTLDLSSALHATTLRIVEGQVLDLGFEHRTDVDSREYLAMIAGKTAAIIRFACWAGAKVAGLSGDRVSAFGALGNAIGMGFQIRDDFLGVWGATETTGKAPADDIRRRKQALPILLLKERSSPGDRNRIDKLYTQRELSPDDIQLVLGLFEEHEISQSVQTEVARWHDKAYSMLQNLGLAGESTAMIESLLDELVN
ncbi:MAG TPA: polyprenyl synthetase family protein, partial [Thermomicrobiales bacterium]|nr:polyprenyl synthetase family protein [Thermomicrobiales bacterium]